MKKLRYVMLSLALLATALAPYLGVINQT